MTLLLLKDIKQDTALQPRAKMDTLIIDEYKESMKSGAKFPPVVVFNIGDEYYLVDGYHRFLAAQGAKIGKIDSDIRPGTMRDAVLHSAGANATHGIRRTNDDKNRAVLILLRDPEWIKWSDNEIAKSCNVSVELVSKARESILPKTDRYTTETPKATPEKRKVKRAGKTYEMKIEKIGKTEPKQDHSKCYSYQPGQIPKTPEVSSAQTLADKIKEPEACTSPPAPDPVPTPEPVVIPPPRPPTPAPCLSLKGCPDFQTHCKTEKIGGRGRICDVLNLPINQLPGPDKECPLERKERLKGTAPEQFVRAGELIEEIAGAKIIKPAPLIIMAVKLNKEEADQRIRDTRGYLTPKDWDAFEEIRKTGELGESYVETFIGLIWFAKETMGGV